MTKRLASILVALCTSAAWASDPLPTRVPAPGDTSDEHLTLLVPDDDTADCPGKGTVCSDAGAAGTLRAAEHVFARVLERGDDADRAPWTLTLTSTLRTPSRRGAIVFLLYDAADPQALAHHEVTGMYQVVSQSTRTLTARLQLTPNDGFSAGHTYRLRVEQIVGRREIVLAEGEITLR